jgi:hypothetical protein
LRIVVLGYVVRCPLGGMAWHYLQYVMGLTELGHDVYFVEDSDDYPSCYDPARHVTDEDPTYGLAFAARSFERIGLADRWAYYDGHRTRWLGPGGSRMHEICATADLVLNISGANPLRPWLMQVPARALIDTDPSFEQIRQLTVPARRDRAAQHTAFFSFGENIGTPSSTVPEDGLPWLRTRQPIVLDAWPVTPGPAHGNFTTIMQWDSYPRREYDGRVYGMKSDSMQAYLDLPQRSGSVFELGLGTPTAPRALFRSHGWVVTNPLEATRDPWTYQDYIRQSKAEFSVAKHGYVVSRSGWFSERSACYLASGRPVLVQDTGFSDWLETGCGVVPFNTPEEALIGTEEIDRGYDAHCRGARDIAEEYFNARTVLSRLVEQAVNAPPSLSARR